MFAPSETLNRVLGIDPGLTRCGFALLDTDGRGAARALSIGVLRTEPSSGHEVRLGQLHADVEALLDEYAPGEVAIERVFFQSNTGTAMSVAQVSGIVMALAGRRGIPVVEYTPSQVKAAIAGWGGADKDQIRDMVRMRLALSELPGPPDAADAAAVALCHVSSAPYASRVAMAIEGGVTR